MLPAVLIDEHADQRPEAVGCGGGLSPFLPVLGGNMDGGHVDAAFALAQLFGGKRSSGDQGQRRANQRLAIRLFAAQIDIAESELGRAPVDSAQPLAPLG
jgi:hypothetical protein